MRRSPKLDVFMMVLVLPSPHDNSQDKEFFESYNRRERGAHQKKGPGQAGHLSKKESVPKKGWINNFNDCLYQRSAGI